MILTKTIRTLVVDDSAIVRKILTRELSKDDAIEVVGTAPDPYVARDKIVALIGDEATIKEYRKKGDNVVLIPRSTEKHYQPIILDSDFMIQGIVITTIPGFN